MPLTTKARNDENTRFADSLGRITENRCVKGGNRDQIVPLLDRRHHGRRVDPRAPAAAEGVFAPTMWIEMQGIPLKTSLRLCLKQLDLDYDVRDGLLFISSPQGLLLADPDHSYLIVGHCVLALVAALIGGVLAPVVSDWRAHRLGEAMVLGDSLRNSASAHPLSGGRAGGGR